MRYRPWTDFAYCLVKRLQKRENPWKRTHRHTQQPGPSAQLTPRDVPRGTRVVQIPQNTFILLDQRITDSQAIALDALLPG